MHITSASKATSVIIRGIPYLIKFTLTSLTKLQVNHGQTSEQMAFEYLIIAVKE